MKEVLLSRQSGNANTSSSGGGAGVARGGASDGPSDGNLPTAQNRSVGPAVWVPTIGRTWTAANEGKTTTAKTKTKSKTTSKSRRRVGGPMRSSAPIVGFVDAPPKTAAGGSGSGGSSGGGNAAGSMPGTMPGGAGRNGDGLRVLGMIPKRGGGGTAAGNASSRERKSVEVVAVPPSAPTVSAVPSPSASAASFPFASASFASTASTATSITSSSKAARRTSLLSAEARLRVSTSTSISRKAGGRTAGIGSTASKTPGSSSSIMTTIDPSPAGAAPYGRTCGRTCGGGDGMDGASLGGDNGGVGEPFSFWSSGYDQDEYDDDDEEGKVVEGGCATGGSMGHDDWDGDGTTAGIISSGVGVGGVGGGIGGKQEGSWMSGAYRYLSGNSNSSNNNNTSTAMAMTDDATETMGMAEMMMISGSGTDRTAVVVNSNSKWSIQNVAPSAARTKSDNTHDAHEVGARAKNKVAATARSAGNGPTNGAAVPPPFSLISPVPIHASASIAVTNAFHANASSNVVSAAAATSNKIFKTTSSIKFGKAKADLTCHPVITSVDKNTTTTDAANTKRGGSVASSTDRSMDRIAALIDVLERSGKLIPMDEGEEEGADASVSISALTADATPKTGTAITTTTPTGGQGLAAYVSASSSSYNPSGNAYGLSTTRRGGTSTFASPLRLESYQHLLLDRFLPPKDVTTPNVGSGTATTGTWPIDTEMTDPFSNDPDTVKDIGSGDGATKKRARGGRGKRTKKVAKKRPGRARTGDTDVGGAITTTTATSRGRGKSGKGPARNDGRPPSLDTYLAGLNEANLKKAEVKRRALEREEEYGLASASANGVAEKGKAIEVDEDMEGEDAFSFDAYDASQPGRGAGGYPKTLATDNDGNNLAPKHCFGRKWLYEVVCEPTGALADASSKENVGPAKKKRRRVFTAAHKNGSSVIGGSTANRVTFTTIGKGAINHRICVRCRHCKDNKDCLRPSSLSDTHFYNLLVFWANNH